MAPPACEPASSTPATALFHPNTSASNGVCNPGHYVTRKWTIRNFNRHNSNSNTGEQPANSAAAGNVWTPQTTTVQSPAKRITITTKTTTTAGSSAAADTQQQQQQRAPYYYHSSVSTTQHSPVNSSANHHSNRRGGSSSLTRAQHRSSTNNKSTPSLLYNARSGWKPKLTTAQSNKKPHLQSSSQYNNHQRQDSTSCSGSVYNEHQPKHYFVYPEFSAHPTDARYGVWQFLLIKPTPPVTYHHQNSNSRTNNDSFAAAEKSITKLQKSNSNEKSSNSIIATSNSIIRSPGFVTSTLQALKYGGRSLSTPRQQPLISQIGALTGKKLQNLTTIPKPLPVVATPLAPPPSEYHFCIRPIKLPVSSVRLDFQLHFLSAHNGLPLREQPVRGSFSCMSGFSLVYQTGFTFQYYKADTETTATTAHSSSRHQNFIPSQLCIIIEMHIMPALTDSSLLMQRTWLAHPADYYLTGQEGPNVRVPCSRQVLIDKSPFFEALLRPACDWGDANRDFWHFSGCSTEAIRLIVRFLYTSTIDTLCSSNDVRAMCDGIKLADMLLLSQLKELLCAKVHTLLDTDPENVLAVFEALFDDNNSTGGVVTDANARPVGFGALVWHDEDLWNHTCERLCTEAFYVVRSTAWVTLRSQKPALAKRLRTLLWSRVGPTTDYLALNPPIGTATEVNKRNNGHCPFIMSVRPKSTAFLSNMPSFSAATPTGVSPPSTITKVVNFPKSEILGFKPREIKEDNYFFPSAMPLITTAPTVPNISLQQNGLPSPPPTARPASINSKQPRDALSHTEHQQFLSSSYARRAPIAVEEKIDDDDDFDFFRQQRKNKTREERDRMTASWSEQIRSNIGLNSANAKRRPLTVVDMDENLTSMLPSPPTTSSSSSCDEQPPPPPLQQQKTRYKTSQHTISAWDVSKSDKVPNKTAQSEAKQSRQETAKMSTFAPSALAFTSSAPYSLTLPLSLAEEKKSAKNSLYDGRSNRTTTVLSQTSAAPPRRSLAEPFNRRQKYKTMQVHSYDLPSKPAKQIVTELPAKVADNEFTRKGQAETNVDENTKPRHVQIPIHRTMPNPDEEHSTRETRSPRKYRQKWSWSEAVAALLLSTSSPSLKNKRTQSAPRPRALTYSTTSTLEAGATMKKSEGSRGPKNGDQQDRKTDASNQRKKASSLFANLLCLPLVMMAGASKTTTTTTTTTTMRNAGLGLAGKQHWRPAPTGLTTKIGVN